MDLLMTMKLKVLYCSTSEDFDPSSQAFDLTLCFSKSGLSGRPFGIVNLDDGDCVGEGMAPANLDPGDAGTPYLKRAATGDVMSIFLLGDGRGEAGVWRYEKLISLCSSPL
jgi:hypothetical protein